MATKAFNLADHIAAVAPASNSDTPKITLLPVRKIFPNKNNFYDTTNIDELVNSILMYGVLDPITVRPSGDGEGFVIISGHRRHRAVTKILDDQLAEDLSKFQKIPCIIRDTKDDLLEELMLIQANSATRVLTSAELGKQAERVERLLYELKEQGYEFPGRMRDNVAAACKVSASKLARLKVIREKLDNRYVPCYEAGNMNESVAYAVARLPAADQSKLLELRKKAYKGDTTKAVRYLQEWKVKDYVRAVSDIRKISCPQGAQHCTNGDAKMSRLFGAEYCYDPCSSGCCSACAKVAACSHACPLLAEKVLALKAEKKQIRDRAKLLEKKRATDNKETRRTVWNNFGVVRAAAGVSVQETLEVQGMYYSSWREKEYQKLESGNGEYSGNEVFPLLISPDDVRKIIALADLLNCSIDYLFGRGDRSTVSAADGAIAKDL